MNEIIQAGDPSCKGQWRKTPQKTADQGGRRGSQRNEPTFSPIFAAAVAVPFAECDSPYMDNDILRSGAVRAAGDRAATCL